jgi:sodium bile acid symporter family protein
VSAWWTCSQKLLGGTIAIFMAGSLLEMGLKLDLKRAGLALRDVRFMLTAFFWSFVIGPALAMPLANRLPLAEPYALGLRLLGLAPWESGICDALTRRIRTEGARVAFDTALAICRHPKASAAAKASAVNSLLRAGGFFNNFGADDGGKDLSQMTPTRWMLHFGKRPPSSLAARVGKTPRREDSKT